MMFILRVILLAIISFATFMLLWKAKFARNKKMRVIIVVAAIVLAITIIILPVENTVVTFESPESAFSYMQKGEVIEVVHGKKSCMIVYEENNNYQTAFVLKTEKGYELPGYYETQTTVLQIDTGLWRGTPVFLEQVGEDLYFKLGFSHKEKPTITDASGADISMCIKAIPDMDDMFVFAYGNIECPLEDYYLLFNGSKISFVAG